MPETRAQAGRGGGISGLRLSGVRPHDAAAVVSCGRTSRGAAAAGGRASIASCRQTLPPPPTAVARWGSRERERAGVHRPGALVYTGRPGVLVKTGPASPRSLVRACFCEQSRFEPRHRRHRWHRSSSAADKRYKI